MVRYALLVRRTDVTRGWYGSPYKCVARMTYLSCILYVSKFFNLKDSTQYKGMINLRTENMYGSSSGIGGSEVIQYPHGTTITYRSDSSQLAVASSIFSVASFRRSSSLSSSSSSSTMRRFRDATSASACTPKGVYGR